MDKKDEECKDKECSREEEGGDWLEEKDKERNSVNVCYLKALSNKHEKSFPFFFFFDIETV